MTTGRQDKAPPDQDGSESQGWAQDWITIWQSEMNALLADRETQEMLRSLLTLWLSAGSGFLDLLARAAPDGAGGRAGPVQPPRPQAAAAASGTGRSGPGDGPELERLRQRVAELEQRLGELERGAALGRPGRAGRRKTARP